MRTCTGRSRGDWDVRAHGRLARAPKRSAVKEGAGEWMQGVRTCTHSVERAGMTNIREGYLGFKPDAMTAAWRGNCLNLSCLTVHPRSSSTLRLGSWLRSMTAPYAP